MRVAILGMCRSGSALYRRVVVPCLRCRGDGVIHHHDNSEYSVICDLSYIETCPTCKGTGVRRRTVRDE